MIKTLVLVRHAHALSSFAAHVQSDVLRPLSPEGQEKAAFTARRLRELKLQHPQILTSPLLRAKQTAQIIGEALSCPVTEEPHLDGMHPDEDVRNFLLDRLQNTDTLIAVGHNPNISYVNHLLCGQIHPFAPGSFAVLCVEDKKVLPSFVFGE